MMQSKYKNWPRVEDLELSRFKRFLLNHYIPIQIGRHKMEGWKRPLPFYCWRCPDHGIVINYRQGHSQTLYCPHCQDKLEREFLRKYSKKHAPIGGGGVSESEEVSIVGNTMRAHSVAFTDPSKGKEAPP